MIKMDLIKLAKLIWKIVIIGDPAVGKTSIRRKYLGETTLKEYIYTIGADFATKRIRLSDNLTVQYGGCYDTRRNSEDQNYTQKK